ncbi:MAG TPA: Mut7-C RNAse domain-containing protein [Desulfopila sp.]|nr:Mut7-C RNAse domain-containing protein [Desulfopila sp.]
MTPGRIFLILHGDLVDLLPTNHRTRTIHYILDRRASIKDIIESQGIPHTEIGRIDIEARQVSFRHIGEDGEKIHLHPFTEQTPLRTATVLHPEPLDSIAFMCDSTVSRLARNMRMAGLDTENTAEASPIDIGRQASSAGRILVSRSHDLLKCRTVNYGQLIRSVHHRLQLQEVFARFRPEDLIVPFSRCLVCNSALVVVDKECIIHFLEPLTKKYYHCFKKCPGCGKIYWHGSHIAKMEKILHSVLDTLD